MSDETWARVEERRQAKQKVLHATTKSQKRKEKLYNVEGIFQNL
jgi:hypothetical protein